MTVGKGEIENITVGKRGVGGGGGTGKGEERGMRDGLGPVG